MIDVFALKKDFSIKALFFSLIWHILFLAVFFPVVAPESLRDLPNIVFLGSILNREEVSMSNKKQLPLNLAKRVTLGEGNKTFFSKSLDISHKPRAAIKNESEKNEPYSKVSSFAQREKGLKKAVFGVRDYDKYLEGVGFGEIRRISQREDLSSYVNFKVMLDKDGSVKDIKKISASGDPVLDLYLLRKIRLAIFKD
ncbi:MAG TPA: hypothetical protein PLU24_01455, partial [Candidatus Omnitrophota bacterium]|nr:hypothetical protein [Candidatus Omnitrophota bacterium]